MFKLTSSNEINSYEADGILDAIVKVRSVAKVEKYGRTYINFLTSDGLNGTIYCRGIHDFKAKAEDIISFKNVKMSRNKGPRNDLKYDLIITSESEVTIIQRDGIKADIELFCQRVTNEDLDLQDGYKTEKESDYEPSVVSSQVNKKRNVATYGTLLENFQLENFTNKEGKMIPCYKSTMMTDKGEQVQIVVNAKVKLPTILLENHRISIQGNEFELYGNNIRFITNKHGIFFEGIGNQRNQEEKEQICEKGLIKTPPKLPPKPLKDAPTPQHVEENQDERKSSRDIQNSRNSTERRSHQRSPRQQKKSCSIL